MTLYYSLLDCRYEYDAIQDYENGRQKVVRDGVETVIIDGPDKKMYEIFPEVDTLHCWVAPADKGSGPTRRKLQMAEEEFSAVMRNDVGSPQDYLGFVLPDLSESRWKHVGHSSISGQKVHVWKWDLTEGEDMDMHYTFYTDYKSGDPVRLVMVGINLYTGGHKDEYLADFFNFEIITDDIDDAEFKPPKDIACEKEDDMAYAFHKSPYHMHAPSKFWGHSTYDSYAHNFGRRHVTGDEYHERLGYFLENKRYIEDWNSNANGGSHRLGINHMADWSDEEYHAILGRKKVQQDGQSDHLSRKMTFNSIPDDFIPSEVIWKGTPADSPVKDQAACGSCWAFSAIAAVESAVARCKGGQTLFSEQSLLDCAWSEKNTGCFGGQQNAAFDWIFGKNGGIATSDSYPYKGVNDYCHMSGNKINVKGNYEVVDGSEEAVKAALWLKGPLAVSVDADAPSFRFYTGGVYSNSACETKAGSLSHAVILSGFGTDPGSGKDYWLVKNMWSPWWGEEGYIRIERRPNDCGIGAEAMFVTIDCDSLP